MAKRGEQELKCSVVVTDGFSDRLTVALQNIYYQRKMMAEIEGTEINEIKDEPA